jgi:hypothetical protein
MKVHMIDQFGTQICVTILDQVLDKWVHMLQKGSVYTISGGHPKPLDPTQQNYAHEVVLDRHTVMQLVDVGVITLSGNVDLSSSFMMVRSNMVPQQDDPRIPNVERLEYVPIHRIGAPELEDTVINVIGMVVAVSLPKG